MKKTVFTLAAAAVFLAGCSKADVVPSANELASAKSESRFTGTTEGIDDGTKTSITYDSYAYSVKWTGAASKEAAKDKILLIDSYNQDDIALCNYMYYYATNVTDDGKKCDFAVYSGDAEDDLTPPYYAIYPDYIYADGKYTLPSVQTYVSATEAASFPMAAKSETTSLAFQNLCGIIHLAVRTSQADVYVRNITVSDAGGKAMSGDITIDWDNLEIESIDGNAAVVLDCSAANDSTGVPLGSEAQFFNIAVPAGTYTPVITVNTMDGGSETMTATKSVSIVRSKFNDFKLSTAEMVFDYAYGNSNCYFISGSNVSDESVEIDITPYCVGGDYLKGAVALKAPEAVSAVVLVTDGDITVSGTPSVDWAAKKLTVSGISGNGNAIVAIKDLDEKIIWSYHIWVPEGNPAATLNYNDKYQVMPFSLGAMDAVTDGVNGWSKGMGAYYQWGRKDPMFASQKTYSTWCYQSKKLISSMNELVPDGQDYTQFAVDYATAYPGHTLCLYDTKTAKEVQLHWYAKDGSNKPLWSSSSKTAYDPCPAGYRVPSYDVYSKTSTSTKDKTKWNVKSYDNYGSGETNEKGYWLKIGNDTYDFYVACGYINAMTDLCQPAYQAGGNQSKIEGFYGTSSLTTINDLTLSFFFKQDYFYTATLRERMSTNIRCVKE